LESRRGPFPPRGIIGIGAKGTVSNAGTMYNSDLGSTDIAKYSCGAGICSPRQAFLENQERAGRSPRLDFCSTFYQEKVRKKLFLDFKSSGDFMRIS
jgi:hypothetical protein